jgi:hypothetical protein
VNTNNVFRGFGGTCEARNNGDAVVRYDQLAKRWLIVMPIFSRATERPDQPPVWTARGASVREPDGQTQSAGPAVTLFSNSRTAPNPAPAPAPNPASQDTSGTNPKGSLFHLLRGQHVRRSTRVVLSI